MRYIIFQISDKTKAKIPWPDYIVMHIGKLRTHIVRLLIASVALALIGLCSLFLIGCGERGADDQLGSHGLEIIKIKLNVGADGHWSGIATIKNTNKNNLLVSQGTFDPMYISFGDVDGKDNMGSSIDDKNKAKISVKSDQTYYFIKTSNSVDVTFQIPLEFQFEDGDLDRKFYETPSINEEVYPGNGECKILTFSSAVYIMDPVKGVGRLVFLKYTWTKK